MVGFGYEASQDAPRITAPADFILLPSIEHFRRRQHAYPECAPITSLAPRRDVIKEIEKCMGPAGNGTCVIGRLTNLSAFASVEQNGRVWVKSYPNVEAAIREAKRTGLVDRLFAAAAAKYISGRQRHCVAPIPTALDPGKLAALGFAQPHSDTKA